MESAELQRIVDAIIENKRLDGIRPHELLASLHRKKLPADALPIVEPLLHIWEGATDKYAIDIIGKMKGASKPESDAVEAAWERSWRFDVPQTCNEAFRALLRIGGNDERLLKMIDRAMQVDNYGIHKECAETLMKIKGGNAVLARWQETIAGQCDCHLHKKLAAKIEDHQEAVSKSGE